MLTKTRTIYISSSTSPTTTGDPISCPAHSTAPTQATRLDHARKNIDPIRSVLGFINSAPLLSDCTVPGRAPVGVGMALPGNQGQQVPRLPAEQPGRQRHRVQLGQQVSRSSAACNTGHPAGHRSCMHMNHTHISLRNYVLT